MKRFICGFLAGALIFGTISAFAVGYVANPVSFKVLVNGKEFVSDPPPLEVNGRTYLPLRAIGDALGVPVNWNEELRQAEVGSPEPVANQYSRNNPAPINTLQAYSYSSEYATDYSADVKVVDIIRGDSAWKKIKEANSFNDEPQDGYEYVLVKVNVSITSIENEESITVSNYDFKSFSGTNEEMPKNSIVEPQPKLGKQLYAGGSTEGWITVQVKKDDTNPKIVYGADYKGTNGIWFSLAK